MDSRRLLVSPELALVDAELAQAARLLLREPGVAWWHLPADAQFERPEGGAVATRREPTAALPPRKRRILTRRHPCRLRVDRATRCRPERES